MIESIASILPVGFKRALRGTRIDTAYDCLRFWGQEFTAVSINVSGESVDYLVPKGGALHSYLKRNDWVYEPGLTSTLIDSLCADDVFYDIGSRYGYYSKVALQAGVEPKNVHCFEADYFNNLVLKKNSGERKTNLNYGNVGADSNTADLVVDSYVDSSNHPTVAKIDVEGAEGRVLAGMKQTLQTFEPKLFVEVHPQYLRDFGDSEEFITEILLDAGYEVSTVDHSMHRSNSNLNWSVEEEIPTSCNSEFLIRARV